MKEHWEQFRRKIYEYASKENIKQPVNTTYTCIYTYGYSDVISIHIYAS